MNFEGVSMQSSRGDSGTHGVSLNDVTRRTLLEAVKSGNQRKITEFYDGYKHIVRYYAIKIAVAKRWFLDDEDIANVIQDVLASILKNNTLSYDAEKGAKFRTWLHRVIKYKIINLIRVKCAERGKVPFDENRLSQEPGYCYADQAEDAGTSVNDQPFLENGEKEMDPKDALECELDAIDKREPSRQDGVRRVTRSSARSPRADEKDDPVLKKWWDEEWRRMIIRKALEQLKQEKDPAHYRAFHRVAVEGTSPDTVAADMGLEVNNVYAIRSRCAQRMKVIVRQMEKQW
jgi:RNA polymerase sigma factor (sigma-70 family)